MNRRCCTMILLTWIKPTDSHLKDESKIASLKNLSMGLAL